MGDQTGNDTWSKKGVENHRLDLPSFVAGFDAFDEERWREKAECRGGNTLFFYKEGRGGANHYDTGKAMCNACGVQSECLGFAVKNRITFGLWGGLSYRERLQYMADNVRPRNKRRQITTITGETE